MKRGFVLSLCSLFFVSNLSAEKYAHSSFQSQQIQDTLQETVDIEDSVIEEIISTKKVPEKDKVQYISQQTKYGFKNLFTSFGYNAALPYSMQVNPRAEVYMQDYLQQHGAGLLNMKKWGTTYFNLIDHIFSQYGLPRELKYLAVIESHLKTGATSWVGAAGPWQFMPYTAKEYGLTVNNRVDERRDYFKSTHAAARYLLTLYRQMHDWLLVIAAYNGGPGRVYDAIKKSGSRNFWSLQYYLPQESRNHVKKFIATHYVMEAVNPTGFNTGSSFYSGNAGSNPYDNKTSLTEEELTKSDKQTITGKYLADIVARNLDMDKAQFNRYNPDFDAKLAANGQYELVLPAEKMQQFLINKYQILNECVQTMLGDEELAPTKTIYPTHPSKKTRKPTR